MTSVGSKNAAILQLFQKADTESTGQMTVQKMKDLFHRIEDDASEREKMGGLLHNFAKVSYVAFLEMVLGDGAQQNLEAEAKQLAQTFGTVLNEVLRFTGRSEAGKHQFFVELIKEHGGGLSAIEDMARTTTYEGELKLDVRYVPSPWLRKLVASQSHPCAQNAHSAAV